ncbi:helix-turn-helix transcriptional regulator [Paenibacillus psychroresistens]|uniref:Helix-turn-helix transcriptional regulator n=1 Tax=Paenibacillus psychroresistens TaxID=1778678 RepID=A0A6B8RV31_9BACL|nr:LuxR C-terminal-related transcriptional regulator [Paenibacillus psychroresistens]QGQ99146.1 helix-turn-helix transcriptional regulator [Paenibacillus psychroresistens]
MNMPILATKLYIPLPRVNAVPRPRLIERLNEGIDRKLTLISASAGFGKTSLVSEWVAACDRPIAWLSLDEGDNNAIRFLTHLVAALQTIAENFGGSVVSALNSPQPPPIDTILTILLNEISSLPYKFVLVLDDYHVIGAKPIDDALIFLIEHLPPQKHLVIATRENPQLPLGRLRARGDLTELRAIDLRFTPGEASTFLNQVMALSISAEEITALESRTEGWIAGLQLAALSMQGREDIPAFIRAFAGDNRYIVDYLVEEVLHSQPAPVRNFLLQTSILGQLHGPLCDAVTGQEDGNARLEVLERGNFFVVPLDDRRNWYRYHHLFAEVLSAHLREEQPDQVATLHRRASMWYEQHGSASDAIRHALATEDFTRAADLVELACPAMSKTRQEATMLGWMRALPIELFHCRPVLSVQYAGTLLSNGELEGIEDLLRVAERWTETMEDMHERPEAPAAEMVVVDEEQFRLLPGSIAMYRAGQSLVFGDVNSSMNYARRVLDLVPLDDYIRRGAANGILGLAYWRVGDLETAHRTFAEGMASLQLAGYISDAIGGSIALTDIRIGQGQLRQAMRINERGLQLAMEHGEPAMRGTADMYVGMSELYREHDDLHAATQNLLRSKEQGEHTGFPQYQYRWRVAMARILEIKGDLDGALDLLIEAEYLYVSDFFPNVRPVAALKARVWIAQGRLGEAFDWVREQGLSSLDELSYLREFEHITMARVLLAKYKSDHSDHSMHEAMELLKRLLQAAEEGERTGSVIEILVLQAIAHHMKGDIPSAFVPLERVLKLAEPEGYVRIFMDEGGPMAILLKEAVKQGIAVNYVRHLLAAFNKTEDRTPAKQVVSEPMKEPLSERERDVLRLLRTDLSGPDMARELFVSLNTLRTHTKNIYDKLEVNSRRAAVRRAEELDLF